MRKFLKTVPMKIYLILLAVVLFSFISNDFGLVDIQKTAIILAAAVDKTEEGFALTAQIAVPKGSDRTTGGTSSVEIEAEGKTVSDCISAIFGKTGWVPKLVFCDLILIGEEAAKDDVVEDLNYFLRNEYMPDSCRLAVCEGKASEFISSKSAIDDASSLAIQKLFSDAAEKSGMVMVNTLKNFAIGYYGVSESSYLPFLRKQRQEGSQSANSEAGSALGTDSSGVEQVYTANETAIFRKGRMVGRLSQEETFAFSLLEGKVFTGTFGAEEKGKPVTLTVMKNEGDVSLLADGEPRAKLSLQVTVRLCCRSISSPIADIATDKITPDIVRHAEETLHGYVKSLWDTCKRCECDLFNLKRALYRSSLEKYAALKDSLLPSLTAQIETKVLSVK